MSGRIDEKTMENVLILAKLELSGQERAQAAAEMEKMNELDTSGVEPMVQPWEIGNVFREDEVTNGDMREELLAGAPAREDGQYVVPRTVE